MYYYFSKSQSSSVADKLAHSSGESSVSIPVGVGTQGTQLEKSSCGTMSTQLKKNIFNSIFERRKRFSRLELCMRKCEPVFGNMAF